MSGFAKYLAMGWMVLIMGLGGSVWAGGPWQPLASDGLHDPKGPAIHELQQPADAFAKFPTDTAGNMVHWVQALRKGVINPRTNILPDSKIRELDLDLIYGNTGDSWFVRFPHLAHTEWLECNNCHEKLFKTKFGATGFKMMDILSGKSCGQCHGAVSFPLTECNRCHSVNPDTFRGKMGPQTKETKP